MELKNGDDVKIIDELNHFKIYRLGNNTVQVFYQRPNASQQVRILEIPKCLVERVVSEYEPTMKEIRQRLIQHGRAKQKGWTFARIREELIAEKAGGGSDPTA